MRLIKLFYPMVKLSRYLRAGSYDCSVRHRGTSNLLIPLVRHLSYSLYKGKTRSTWAWFWKDYPNPIRSLSDRSSDSSESRIRTDLFACFAFPHQNLHEITIVRLITFITGVLLNIKLLATTTPPAETCSRESTDTTCSSETMTSTNSFRSRKVLLNLLSREQGEGVGARVRRTIGRQELRSFDPFLMLVGYVQSCIMQPLLTFHSIGWI